MSLFLLLFLQIVPQLPIPLPPVPDVVGGEIEGPYIFREDLGQTTKVILKNGLTVIVREHNALPLTAITTHVRVGRLHEPDDRAGIAQVVEHMFFVQTGHHGPGELAREMRTLGGTLAAHTDYDRTVFQAIVPSDHAVEALELQADALRNPVFDEAFLAREVEMVLREDGQRLADPAARALDRLYATAFPDHAMGRPRGGDPEVLRSLTPDQVEAFRHRYYQPSNIILTVAGRFVREPMLAEIIRIYGEVEDHPPAEPGSAPSAPTSAGTRYNWERGPIAQAHIALGFQTPGPRSDDTPALEVLSAILTSGRAARLNRFLRDEQHVLDRAASSLVTLPGLGFFQIQLEAADPVEAGIATLGEIERIQQFGVNAEQLQRAKVMLAQEYYHRLETVESIGLELARQEALGGWKRMNEHLPAIQAVRARDVLDVARRHLGRENLALFEYLPETISRSWSDSDFRTNVLDRVPTEIVERSIEELPVPAEVQLLGNELVVDLISPPVRRSVLRGPDVYVLEDHRLPLVSFGIFFPGGRLYESDTNAGITELMLRSALRGTRRYNSADVSRRLENAGAVVEVVNEPDFFGYVLDGVSGQIDEALEILMEVLQEPTFLEEAVEHERALQIARVRGDSIDLGRRPVQLFRSLVFDGHAYGRSGLGSEDSLGAITTDDLTAWHRQNQRMLVPLILIVGDTRGTGLVASIAETLTNEDLFPRDILSLPVPDVHLARRQRIERADQDHTALVYGFAGPERRNDDRYALAVIESALSGIGGRLSEAIRSPGLAPTVRISSDLDARSGAVYVSTTFDPEHEAEILESLDAEFERLASEGVSEEELATAISFSVGAHDIRMQTRLARLMESARAIFSGLEISAVTDHVDSIRRVGREFVESTAARYLGPRTAQVGIVRGGGQ